MTLPSARPLIYVITPGDSTRENFERSAAAIVDIVTHAVRHRIPLVQIREKSLPAGLLFDLTVKAACVCRGSETKLLVNGRTDIALAAGAVGVHLPTNGLPVAAVRSMVPDGFIIGVSCHSIDDVENSKKNGADFAVLGPVFETPGKGNPVGIDSFADAIAGFGPFPVLALGGIAEHNYRSVLGTGAAGFAAIRFLNDSQTLGRIGTEFYS